MKLQTIHDPGLKLQAERGKNLQIAFGPARRAGAFTLLEVMIASGILFLCLFAILQLLSSSLRNARILQRTSVDPGMPAAELSLTNKLSEGPVPMGMGGFEKLFPDYRYDGQITEVGTNGLFQVDFVVYRRSGDRGTESHMSIILFRPESTRVGRMNGL